MTTATRGDGENVLHALREALQEYQRPWLCMITAAYGSSPRPVGALVAVNEHGVQTGSISGGCVEEALIADLLAGHYDRRQPVLIDYGVTAEENEKLGLPCGGRLTIAVQRLQADDTDWITEAIDQASQRHVTRRQIDRLTGESALETISAFEPLQQNDTLIRHCFGPRSRLLLVGAGQLAACVASIALAMDYEVILTDSRTNALEQWQGPDIEKVLGLPDDVVRSRAADRHSAVITLSHDPRVDDMALMEALETDAWYVGALGSLRTTDKRRQRLLQLGLSESVINRLHAPIGLNIGSKTPMEIAVAIMAEMTQLRRELGQIPQAN